MFEAFLFSCFHFYWETTFPQFTQCVWGGNRVTAITHHCMDFTSGHLSYRLCTVFVSIHWCRNTGCVQRVDILFWHIFNAVPYRSVQTSSSVDNVDAVLLILLFALCWHSQLCGMGSSTGKHVFGVAWVALCCQTWVPVLCPLLPLSAGSGAPKSR